MFASSSVGRYFIAASALAAGLATVACGPDVEARYSEFLEGSSEQRPQGLGGPCEDKTNCQSGLVCKAEMCSECSSNEDCGGGVCNPDTNLCQANSAFFDINGFHHVVLSTVVAYDLPLQFAVEIQLGTLDAGTAPIHLEFQPLSLNSGETNNPREAIGDIIIVDTVVNADGTFTADMGIVTVVGEANPVSGLEIVASVVLEGRIQSEDFWCGQVTGEVMAPIQSGLEPSYFGATRLPDNPTYPDDLPTDDTATPSVDYMMRCPEDL